MTSLRCEPTPPSPGRKQREEARGSRAPGHQVLVLRARHVDCGLRHKPNGLVPAQKEPFVSDKKKKRPREKAAGVAMLTGRAARAGRGR
jgi:hypothetical protein